jgi:isopentenyl-diphosphate delta-isomerase
MKKKGYFVFVILLLQRIFCIIYERTGVMKSKQTSTRKQQHVTMTLNEDVSFRKKTTGFERWEFVHQALPEMQLSQLDTSAEFLGKTVAFPLIVSSMTGGYREALQINRNLAELCRTMNIALGVGSQRQTWDDAAQIRSFSIVREVAPDIPIFGNLGAAEVARLTDSGPIQRFIDMIRADGFAIHLNPLQEFLQPEGDTNFEGVLRGIEMLVRTLPVPVIVKEVGAGISARAARQLSDAGVRIIDVAGAGGTSWAGIELLRSKRKIKTDRIRRFDSLVEAFWDWGIPTAEAVRQAQEVKREQPDLRIIASGGIKSGMDVAKAIALGADYVAVARPVLQGLHKNGVLFMEKELERWKLVLQGAMFLTGSRTIKELQHAQMVETR